MDESLIPSLSAGPVGSRFISQNEVDNARAKREEQWKAAYARIGQEPPPQQQEDSYDGRSLAEKLAANRVAKQEEWEEKTKLANQFRALEEDEIMFLDSVRERQEEEERRRKEKDGEEVKSFKEAVAARTSTINNLPIVPAPTTKNPSATKFTPVSAVKKDVKKTLKGVVMKRKARLPTTSKAPLPSEIASVDTKASDELQPATKRPRTSE